ncbi:hypothetical protein [Mycoplasma hafezii]|uniref:hypothetical protein n=1 Tax=Mycoplasma hafezii TaxID=525886 RepID=UPI003CF33AAC
MNLKKFNQMLKSKIDTQRKLLISLIVFYIILIAVYSFTAGIVKSFTNITEYYDNYNGIPTGLLVVIAIFAILVAITTIVLVIIYIVTLVQIWKLLNKIELYLIEFVRVANVEDNLANKLLFDNQLKTIHQIKLYGLFSIGIPMGIVIFGIPYIAQGKKVSANIDQLINAFTKVEDNVKIVEK